MNANYIRLIKEMANINVQIKEHTCVSVCLAANKQGQRKGLENKLTFYH